MPPDEEEVELKEPKTETLEVLAEADPPETPETPGGNRSSRQRASNYRQLEEKYAQAAQQIQQQEQRIQEQDRNYSELRGGFQALERSIQSAGQPNDARPESVRRIDEQIEVRQLKLQALNRDLKLIKDEAQREAFVDAHREEAIRLDEEIADLRGDRRDARREAQNPPQRQPNPQLVWLEQNHPEKLRDPQFVQGLKEEIALRNVRGKSTAIKEVVDAVLARRSNGQSGMRGPPTERTRSMMTATGQSAGNGGAKPNTLRIEKSEQNLRLARAALHGKGTFSDDEALSAYARMLHAAEDA